MLLYFSREGGAAAVPDLEEANNIHKPVIFIKCFTRHSVHLSVYGVMSGHK